MVTTGPGAAASAVPLSGPTDDEEPSAGAPLPTPSSAGPGRVMTICPFDAL
jgi:hypothetical protein